MKEKIKLLVYVWTIGLFFGLIFLIFRITRRIKIQGYSRSKLDPKDKGLSLISNHPSLWEPALLPFLFFPWYLFSLRFVPFSVVDKTNYYDKLWFLPFRRVSIPIERGKSREEIKAVDAMIEMLRQGRILILYPEGRRTFKPGEFKVSAPGNKIHKFPRGLRKLFGATSTPVLPIWTQGGDRVIPNKLAFPRFPHFPFPRIWRQTIIKIGEPFILRTASKNEIIETLEDVLLKLGDRE